MLIYDCDIFEVNFGLIKFKRSTLYSRVYNSLEKELWKIIPGRYYITEQKRLRKDITIIVVQGIANAILIKSTINKNRIGIKDTIFLRCATKPLADVVLNGYNSGVTVKNAKLHQLFINANDLLH